MTNTKEPPLRAIFAISLTQPWATLMALGLKRIETRSWPTRYVGPVALHAATRFDTAYRDLCEQEPFRSALLSDPCLNPRKPLAQQLPRGKVLALARLDRWELVTPETELPEEPERSFGNYAWGRYLFHFTHLHPLEEPFDAQGALGIWPLAVPENLHPRLEELGEASLLRAIEQVPSLIVDEPSETHEQPRGRRRLTSRLATEDMTSAGLAHLHRMGQLLHLKPEWFQEGGAVPHYILYGEHKRSQAILHGAKPVKSIASIR